MAAQHRLLVPLLALLLSGCAGLGPREALEGSGSATLWKQHRQETATVDGWQLSGKLGIRSAQETGSGTLFWLQRQDYFDIRLAGPLGRGASRLLGRPDAVTLEVAGQGRFTAESPEALLEAQLGWRLPVSNLLWWVRGLPAPGTRSRLTLNADSRLAHLEQDGWNVHYLGYLQQNGYTLPERIQLDGHDLQLTLVIKDWQPRQLGHP